MELQRSRPAGKGDRSGPGPLSGREPLPPDRTPRRARGHRAFPLYTEAASDEERAEQPQAPPRPMSPLPATAYAPGGYAGAD